MKYNGVIEAKLRVIEMTLHEMESWQIDSFSAFKSSSLLQKAVERALQVAIEAMIDTSEHILALEKEPASTALSAIIRLQELGMISNDKDYMEMIRFRNFIVHRYEKIDIEIVYSILKNKLPQFRKFIHEIRQSCS